MKDPHTQGGLVDPDWMPPMMIDASKGRGFPAERIGKDGLPIIGCGSRVSAQRLSYISR